MKGKGVLHLIWAPGWATREAAFRPLRERLDAASGAGRLPTLVHSSVPFAGCSGPDEFPAAIERKLNEGSADAPVVLVGWSLGAIAALDVAARRDAGRSGGSPHTSPGSTLPALAGLILIAGTARFTADPDLPGSPGWPKGVVRRMRIDLERDPEGTLDRFYALLMQPDKGAAWPAAWRDPGPWLRGGLDYLAGADLREAVPSLRCEVLGVHGDQDAVVPVDAGRALAEQLPRATFVPVVGAGHAPQVTAQEATAAPMIEFLAKTVDREASLP